MIILVGYTGFVGSNIYVRARNRIEGVYNSNNVEKAYGLESGFIDLCRAARQKKYLANSAPEKDLDLILNAERNIRKLIRKTGVDINN